MFKSFIAFLCCLGYALSGDDELEWPEEKFFANIRQLTWLGENVNAIFSERDNTIVYQATDVPMYGRGCGSIYKLDPGQVNQSSLDYAPERISSGVGLATRAQVLNDEALDIVFSSTPPKKYCESFLNKCPVKKCSTRIRRKNKELDKFCKSGHNWDLFPEQDIYVANRYGETIIRLTNHEGYDGDVDVSPSREHIAFTSMRSGDPEIWLMNLANKTFKQLTQQIGYEGHATFSADGKRIVFQASQPKTRQQFQRYERLLSYDLVSPLEMEIFVMNSDGTNLQQITHNGATNLSPSFINGDTRVLFTSNHRSLTKYAHFALYTIDLDGKHLQQVTSNLEGFNGFARLDTAEKRIIWTSNRNATLKGEMNLFMADWIAGNGELLNEIADDDDERSAEKPHEWSSESSSLSSSSSSASSASEEQEDTIY